MSRVRPLFGPLLLRPLRRDRARFALTVAGIAVGADGLFLEIHDNPSEALSDRNNSLIINKLEGLLRSLLVLRQARDEGDEQSG